MKKLAYLVAGLALMVSGAAMAQTPPPKIAPPGIKQPLKPAGTSKILSIKLSGACDQPIKWDIEVENTMAREANLMVHFDGSGDIGQYLNVAPQQKVTYSMTPKTPVVKCSQTEAQCWDAWLTPNLDKAKGMQAIWVDQQKIHFCAVNKPGQGFSVGWKR